MKNKVKMTCILKSGVKVDDSIEANANDFITAGYLQELQRNLEESIGHQETKISNFTFGVTTIAISEIAAITFKEN